MTHTLTESEYNRLYHIKRRDVLNARKKYNYHKRKAENATNLIPEIVVDFTKQ